MPHAACSSFTRTSSAKHAAILCSTQLLQATAHATVARHLQAFTRCAALAVPSPVAFLRCQQHSSAAPWPRLTTGEPRLALNKKHYRLQLQRWGFGPCCSAAPYSLQLCLAITATPPAPSGALRTSGPPPPDTPSITARPTPGQPSPPSPSSHHSSTAKPVILQPLTPRPPRASAPASGSSSGSAAGC
jgi:hypothetical protein